MHCDADVRPTRKVLLRHVAEEPLRKPQGGRKPKLTHGESLVAADCLARGKGREQTAYEVSAYRQRQGKSAVSAKAVRTGFAGMA